MKRVLVAFLAVGALVLGLVPQAHAGGPYSAGVHDFAFAPDPIAPGIGQQINWLNSGAAPHTATDNGPFHLWDTGKILSGNTGVGVINFAGTYTYICTIHHFTGTAEVAVLVTPDGGPASISYDVEWATAAAPAKTVNHVQERVNGGAWSTLYRGKNPSATESFSAGTWDVRSRLESRRHPKQKHGTYAPLQTFVVT
jgi:plastocyanin